MVLPNTYTSLESENVTFWRSFRRLEMAVSVTRLTTLLALTCLSINVSAQEQDFDFVDALAPVDASASAFHNEKFNDAEKALMEGLSRRGTTQAAAPKQPEVRQVSANQQQTVSQQIPKLLEASERPEPSFRNDGEVARPRANHASPSSTGSNTQLLKAINDQTGQQVEAPKVRESKNASGPGTGRVALSKEPASSPKPKSETGQQPKQAIALERASGPKASDETAQVQELRRELADTKSQLAAAELEISRLSAIIQDASRARLSLPPTSATLLKAAPKEELRAALPSEVKQVASPRQAEPVAAPDPNHDLQVATITVDKADLRLGPGRNHSALMSLRRGSRLAVEARQGEWYRVFAPNGQRAWIHASLVRFGDGASSLNDGSSVMVKGYDSAIR